MTPQSTTPVSPKVVAGTVAGVLASIAVAILSALLIDPSGLGVDLPTWALFLLAAAGPVVIQALAAYGKRDPLRDAGQAAIQGQVLNVRDEPYDGPINPEGRVL